VIGIAITYKNDIRALEYKITVTQIDMLTTIPANKPIDTTDASGLTHLIFFAIFSMFKNKPALAQGIYTARQRQVPGISRS
jgi:hypothetical protein